MNTITSPTTNTTTQNKIIINSIKFIAKKNLPFDICAICYEDILDKCNKCINNNNQCYSVVGTCSHAYHYCCINSWISTQHYVECPLCKQKWELKRRSI